MVERTSKKSAGRKPARRSRTSGSAGSQAKGRSAGKPPARKSSGTQAKAPNRKSSAPKRRPSRDNSLIARAERAVPKSVAEARQSVAGTAKRAGRALAAQGKDGAGLAGTGKYFAAGALAGAALGAAFEAAQGRRDDNGPQRTRGEGLWGLAHRIFDAVGEFTGHLAEKAEGAVQSLVKSDSDESDSDASDTGEQPADEPRQPEERAESPAEEHDGGSDSPDEAPVMGADSDEADSDDLLRQSDLTEVTAFEVRTGLWTDEEPADEPSADDAEAEDSIGDAAMFQQPKRRKADLGAEFERNWEA